MAIFSDKFGQYVCTGDTITGESEGFRLVATIEDDSSHGPPWKEEDGHGPVSDWTSRDKRPGELVLNSDHGSKRFYDYAAACELARNDGWGFLPGAKRTWQDGAYWFASCEGVNEGRPLRGADINEAIRALHEAHKASFPSARAYAAAAARADFDVLQAWCDDEWDYCGVVVTVSRAGVELATESLWGIERNYPRGDNSYLSEVAEELTGQALDVARAKLQELAK